MRKKLLIIALLMVIVVAALISDSVADVVNGRRYPADMAVISYNDSGDRRAENSVIVKSGDCFKVELSASGGTGYQWNLLTEKLALIKVLDRTAGPANQFFSIPGGQQKWVYYLQAKKGYAGQEILRFRLARPVARPREPEDSSAKLFILTVMVRE